MILTRLGNKRKIVKNLVDFFPPHKMRIELFFGAGGSYFYLPKPKYCILNDLDDDVFNLYMVVLKNSDNLKKEICRVPLSQSLIKYWKANRETNEVLRAVRFLFLSNFTYMGKGDTLRLGLDNAKLTLLNNIDKTLLDLKTAKITNLDFREVLPKISFSKSVNDKEKCFVYLDPIYFETEHYYNVPEWSRDDTADCIEIVHSSGIKTAMSEFPHPYVLSEAKRLGLNVFPVKNRSNIKNRNTEILITNYEPHQLFI